MSCLSNLRQRRPGWGTALTVAFAFLLFWTWLTQPSPVRGGAASDTSALEQQFTRDIWPLLTRSGASCVGCHTKNNPSQLHLPTDPASAFHQLIADGRFDPHSPGALSARIATADPAQRMPPTGMPGWTDAEQSRLRDFMVALAQGTVVPVGGGATTTDEQFPPALRLPYSGPKPATAEGLDNGLLSYYQLRHKVALLFGDDWRRDNRDLYVDNLAQIGGADFATRFDESSRPTPGYLSAVGALAADVASRAYLNRTGPFAGRPGAMPLPGAGATSAVQAQVSRLYRTLLFRAPSAAERRDASGLLAAVARSARHGDSDRPLMFQVVVRDAQGRQSAQQATVGRLPAGQGMSALYVNEDVVKGEAEAQIGVWTLRPQDPPSASKSATAALPARSRSNACPCAARCRPLRRPSSGGTRRASSRKAPGTPPGRTAGTATAMTTTTRGAAA